MVDMTLANGEQLPQIDGKNLDGESVSLADLTGVRLVGSAVLPRTLVTLLSSTVG